MPGSLLASSILCRPDGGNAVQRSIPILLCCLSASGGWKALGPFAGPAALVQTDPLRPGVVIAGTSSGRLFRSLNGGETWDPMPFPPDLQASLQTFLIHPQTPNLYFAGIAGASPEAPGLLVSADGGESWSPATAFRGKPVRALACFRGDSGVIVAGTDIGVFRSNDGGNVWEPISPAENHELRPVMSVAFDPKDRNVIYAGTPHLPWKTTDGGKTWESIHAGMADDSDVFSILVDRNRGQRLLAGACSGIYRSADGGGSWSRPRAPAVTSGRIYTVVQDPQYENVLFAGSASGLLRSENGGESWQKLLPRATRSIAFDLRHQEECTWPRMKASNAAMTMDSPGVR